MKLLLKLTLLVMALSLMLTSFASCNKEIPPMKKWYTFSDTPEIHVTQEAEEFPKVTFDISRDGIYAVKGDKQTLLVFGMPVYIVYAYDINGDGKREICANTVFGSGMADMRVVICDYANGIIYHISGRLEFHDFSLIEQDGQLCVFRHTPVYPSEQDPPKSEIDLIVPISEALEVFKDYVSMENISE